LQLSGKTVTLSVKIRKNASLTTDLNLVIAKSATVDASYSATWTTIQQTTIANASMPTGTTSADWYTASVTATVPNDGTANSLRIGISEVSTQPSGAYWEISQAQLELGSVATAFSRAGGTIQGELAACQRYFNMIASYQANAPLGTGTTSSTTLMYLIVPMPVAMRTNPTIYQNSGTNYFSNINYSFNSWTGVDQTTTKYAEIYVAGSGFTAGQAGVARLNSASGYLGLSAEL